MRSDSIKNIVVVGGGTAGWITAGILAAKCALEQGRNLTVTLVESPTVGTVGVGEGTWPSMRTTLKDLGVCEADFIRACDATFKQGARFNRWVDGSESDFYYHPLMLPAYFAPLNSLIHWLGCDLNTEDLSYSTASCYQEAACEAGLAPKAITTPQYQGVLNYAYHLDTHKFSEFIKKHCIETLNVVHKVSDVTGVRTEEDGAISSLILQDNTELPGDFYIDCSGFSGVLIDKHFHIPFADRSEVLFCDRALAVQCPYDQAGAIASHTVSTATGSGWIWDIGLQSRRGVGHVYSSRYCSDSDAEQVLRRHLGEKSRDLPIKSIRYTPGHRERFWVKNCVAVGLSAGFVEPLEASSILLVELSAYWIAEKLPLRRSELWRCEKQFNDIFQYRWNSIIEFLKLHYCLSSRKDTPFWRDNTSASSIPASLIDKLERWKEKSPSVLDFLSRADVFPLESYCFVMYGMNFKTSTHDPGKNRLEKIQAKIDQYRKETDKVLAFLPQNRTLLNAINEHGLQRI
ncbi:tryptophan halogenase family protein [Gilvimarinus algae]|uniref:Tryptophan 7-halogenase n=1 Tax=Gilvimarinus algae TaxID=3058037 RepID=A0ABT8TBG9_9GAMM|nr:tryptophan halogenase family protein [Gilvimarinus sp. SDUM040014]MDO3381363.1 tryptophan 7-halogenase [Gilvimarinus sp. SDUM040014]